MYNIMYKFTDWSEYNDVFFFEQTKKIQWQKEGNLKVKKELNFINKNEVFF